MENDTEEVVVDEEVKPEETPAETETETTDWKAKYEETQGRLRRAETKLSKVKEPETKSEKQPSKSDDLDYGQKAFLIANGIKGEKELDFVKSELKKSNENLDALLENEYFKSKLDKFRALGKTAEATPTGKRSGGVAIDSLEYWVEKAGANAENLSEVPANMRTQVVNALKSKADNQGKFYNS